MPQPPTIYRPEPGPGEGTGQDDERRGAAASRARMPLIDLITSGALDEEYVEVARRRPPRPPGSHRPRPGLVGAVAVLFFAVLVTIAFQQTRDNEDVVDAGRATLEDRIRTRRDDVSRAQDRIVELRRDNNAAESNLDVLDQGSDEAGARLRVLRTDTGFSAVRGEGVRIVVGDPPDGRVSDADLALLSNGLWQAGAEAISINGQRLTALSAIRFSGGTIRINRVNLSPPYTVEAIGDEDTLAADLLETGTGLKFAARADELGFTFRMQNVDRLSLPSAPARLLGGLRSARSIAVGDDEVPPAGEERTP